MSWLASHAAAFLFGAFTGATGKYLADKFTDQRRKKESRDETKQQFERVRAQMPELIAEMKHDLNSEGHGTIRDVLVIERDVMISTGAMQSKFAFYRDDHEDLDGKVTVLENCGYVRLIESGPFPTYRLTEHFVQLILKS